MSQLIWLCVRHFFISVCWTLTVSWYTMHGAVQRHNVARWWSYGAARWRCGSAVWWAECVYAITAIRRRGGGGGTLHLNVTKFSATCGAALEGGGVAGIKFESSCRSNSDKLDLHSWFLRFLVMRSEEILVFDYIQVLMFIKTMLPDFGSSAHAPKRKIWWVDG